MPRVIVIAIVVMTTWLGTVAQTSDTAMERAMRALDAVSSLLNEQEHNIVQLEAQLDNIARQQHSINDSITRHKWQLAQLRAQYAQVVRNINAHSSTVDRLAYIFSASSFTQAWQRASYLRQLSQWRSSRSRMLDRSLRHLADEQQRLGKLMATRQASLAVCNDTRAALQVRLDEATALIAELKLQAPQLHSVLTAKRQQAGQLSQSLDVINKSQNMLAQEPGKETFNLSPGSLHYPVAVRHRVTATFGRQKHPSLQYVTTINNGIDITCLDMPAQALAVESGTVSGIYDQGGGKCIVMIRHGDFMSVYAGLTHITVKKGQPVAGRQPLGDIAVNTDSYKPQLHFELRHGTTALDPANYLK